MSDRERFLAERQRGIGGSDIDDVFSLPPYGCARKLWNEKTGVPADFEVSNDAILRGVALEPLIVEMFRQKTGYVIERRVEAFFDGTDPFLLVHVDFLYEDESGRIGVGEVKSMGREAFKTVTRKGMPQGYILQLQHGMMVTGAQISSFIVHCADLWSKPLIWPVVADREMQDMIRQACREFWKKVQRGEEPKRLDASDARCKKCQYRSTCQGEYLDQLLENPGAVDRDDSLAGLLAEVLEAKEAEKQAAEVVELLETQLKKELGDRQVVDAPGARVYYKASERVTPYNSEAIKEKREALLRYAKEIAGSSLSDCLIEILTPRVTKTRTLRVYARGK